jgi:hypothetical protein
MLAVKRNASVNILGYAFGCMFVLIAIGYFLEFARLAYIQF